MKWSTVGLLGAAGVLTAAGGAAAETVHLYLKAAGADIRGDSTQISLGRQNSIECVQIDYGVRGAAESRRYEQFRCVKRIDKSSPLLMRHLILGSPIEGVFKFFRPNPTGDGTTEQFYTVTIKGGRIEGVRVLVPSTIDPATSNRPPMEEVTFSYRSIAYVYTNGGISAEDGAVPSTTAPQMTPLTR